jgi:hypothetical protein
MTPPRSRWSGSRINRNTAGKVLRLWSRLLLPAANFPVLPRSRCPEPRGPGGAGADQPVNPVARCRADMIQHKCWGGRGTDASATLALPGLTLSWHTGREQAESGSQAGSLQLSPLRGSSFSHNKLIDRGHHKSPSKAGPALGSCSRYCEPAWPRERRNSYERIVRERGV